MVSCACFLQPTKSTFLPLAAMSLQEILRGLELLDRVFEVDDVDAVARFENEGLHLGVPALRAVAKMDAGVQEFLDIDSVHDVLFGL